MDQFYKEQTSDPAEPHELTTIGGYTAIKVSMKEKDQTEAYYIITPSFKLSQTRYFIRFTTNTVISEESEKYKYKFLSKDDLFSQQELENFQKLMSSFRFP